MEEGRRETNRMYVLLGSYPLHVLVLFSCLFFLYPRVHAQDLKTVEDCSASGNYTSNSQFQANLNLLLHSLVSNGTRNGFFNTTIGANPDSVYGLVQCRGDISMEECQICLNTSSVEILRICPNRKEAALRTIDYCLLRYSNLRFFDQVDDRHPPYDLKNPVHVSEADADRFDQQLEGLMDNLSNTASSRPSRYDAGWTDYTVPENIYGLVQCTRDLSPTNCLSCLRTMISRIPGLERSRGAKVFTKNCYMRFEMSPFVFGTTQEISTTTGNGKDNSTNVVAIVVPIVISVFLLAICGFFISRRIRKNRSKRKPEIIYDQDDIIIEDSLQFDLITIRIATNEFSDTNKLGEGGFGVVYKGQLLDGKEIAVKRLSKNSGQGSQEFKNEVVLLHKLQHRNLVRLLGFCLSGEEKLLIYEFVSNRSLDKYIFDPTKKALLDWERRYKIIEGIARGILYLHEDSRLRIIHHDLKAGNILLDEEMNAKIADFGMAKLFRVDQTQGNTSKIAGTYGYMAPEYALQGFFSVKSDVYSFGVLLLEIVSGQKSINFHLSNPTRDLLSCAWKLWREGNALQLMDPTLMDSFVANEVMRCIYIGLLCIQEDYEDRPTMSSINLMLNSYSTTLKSPLAPPIILETRTGAYDSIKNIKFNDSTNSSHQYSMVESLYQNPR